MAETNPDYQTLYQPLIIKSIREEVPGFKTILLEEPSERKITYLPGQYLTFVLPHHETETRRSYSIISAPVRQEPLAIGVKRIANGLFSRKLIDHAKPGDTLWTTGAAGFFTLPDDLTGYNQLFFLAAGSGITPMLSLIKTVLFGTIKMPVVLIYSNRSEAETLYRRELLELAAAFPDRFRMEFLYSNSADLSRARLRKDLVLAFVRQHAAGPLEKLLCYVCGPQEYMRMCTYGLNLAGVPLANIKKENFNVEKVSFRPEPPDTRPHLVSVLFKNQLYTFPAQYPDTILQAAKKAGLNLPYSCEAGKCGNCATLCKTGTVWMSYNEVLTEKELQKGLVLTCVGYPAGGDVMLEAL